MCLAKCIGELFYFLFFWSEFHTLFKLPQIIPKDRSIFIFLHWVGIVNGNMESILCICQVSLLAIIYPYMWVYVWVFFWCNLNIWCLLGVWYFFFSHQLYLFHIGLWYWWFIFVYLIIFCLNELLYFFQKEKYFSSPFSK